jgi:hypothetical protein
VAETLILFAFISIVVPAIIGLLWSLVYWLYRRNSPIAYKVFESSLKGGVLGAIVGLYIGNKVGQIASQNAESGFFVGGAGLAGFVYLVLFWIIGTIEGAILGGLIFIRIYY